METDFPDEKQTDINDNCEEELQNTGPEGPRILFGHHYHHSSFITDANDLRC